MENLEISKVEKKQVQTGFTGFDVFEDNDSYEDVNEDDYAYDHIEIDYVEKLRTQRERVNYTNIIDGKT